MSKKKQKKKNKHNYSATPKDDRVYEQEDIPYMTYSQLKEKFKAEQQEQQD